jgi:hypothetical protein
MTDRAHRDWGWRKHRFVVALAAILLVATEDANAQSIEDCIRRLKFKNSPTLWEGSYRTLERHGERAARPLTDALSSSFSDWLYRNADFGGVSRLACGLERLGPKAASVRWELVRLLLNTQDPGPDPGFPYDQLSAAKRAGIDEFRVGLLRALGAMGTSKALLPWLRRIMKDDQEGGGARTAAAVALVMVSPSVEIAAPAAGLLIGGLDPKGPLRSLSGDARLALQDWVLECLGALRDPSALSALCRVLDSTHARHRLRAAEAIGWLGADGAPALRSLKGLLEDPEKQVRLNAKWAITHIEREKARKVKAAKKRRQGE